MGHSRRIAALLSELAREGPTAAERFWAEVAHRGTPLVEALGGGRCVVTFLWRDRHGIAPGTSRVLLIANKLTDPSVWDASTLRRIPGSDIWHRSYILTSDWRATYQLAPVDGVGPGEAPPPAAGPATRWGPVAHRAAPDPLNPRRFATKRGGPETSIVELPDAPPQPWLNPTPGGPPPTLSRHLLQSTRLGNSRTVWLQTPTSTPDRGVPASLVILLDGEDWVGRLAGPITITNLVAAGLMGPTVVVMPDALDVPTRWREMTCRDIFIDFLLEELIPWVAERHPISADPAHTTVVGQSIGGLTAAYAALRAPDRIGAALVQSASLWWSPPGHHAQGAAIWLGERFVERQPQGTRIYLEVGTEEWTLLDDHRHLADTLRRHGYPMEYHEFNGGHDALCWRGGLATGLIALERMRRSVA